MDYKTIFFSLIFCIVVVKGYTKDVKEILKQIPAEEKQALTRLFYSLIQKDHLGYTLFADKPICLTGHFKTTPIGNIFANCAYEEVFWYQWKIWKKYENLFLNKDYLVIEEPSPCPNNSVTIIVINKQAFVKKIDCHLNIFRRFLGPETTGQNLLTQVESIKKLSPIIKNNQMLWGILLDYGIRNASLFYRREQIRPFFSKKIPPKVITKVPSPSKQFSSLKEEYDYLNSHLKQFDESDYSPHLIQTVHFMADPYHPETLSLKKKYKRLQGKISSIYSQGDFLEITLTQIAK